MAACVFDGVEKQWGKGTRFMDLEALGKARVWHEETVGFIAAQTLRRFEVNLSQKTPGEVQIEVAHIFVISGSEFYMGRLRPIFRNCDGARTASAPAPSTESLKASPAVAAASQTTVLADAAVAQVKGPPPLGTIDRLFVMTEAAIAMCSIQVSYTQQAGKGHEDINKCIEKERKRIADSYTALTPTLSRKAEAEKSAKQYYVFGLTALDGVRPLPGERVYQFEARQNANRSRLKELENLLRVDAQ